MFNTIVEIMATVIDIIFLVWFVPRLQQVSMRQRPISWLLAGVLLTFQLIGDQYLQGFNMVYMAGVITISLFFALSLRSKQPWWAIFSAFVYVIVLMLASSAVYALFSSFIDELDDIIQGASTYLRAIYLAVCKLAQFAFYQLILYIFKKNHLLDFSNGILSFIFTVATAFGLGALMKLAASAHLYEINASVISLAVVLVFMNIILYVMIFKVQELLKSKYELKLMQERMDFEKTRLEEAKSIWDNIRKIKHDLKNHFTVLQGHLEKEEIEASKTYVQELGQKVENMGDLIHSGNTVIDYLINSKLANLKGVQVLISGYVGNLTDLDDVDLACILGNIIDNAVEAQEYVSDEKEKRIELLFLQKNANRMIICKNTIQQSVLKDNKRLLSTKKEPEVHGLGHQIVEATAEKYQGMVDYFEEDDMFGVQVMLPMNI